MTRVLLGILPVAAVITLRADDIPKRPNFDRYTAMLQHSPFAVATAVAVPAATPNFAKDLYVANAAHTGQADFVTVISAADKNMREYLSTEKPNEHGFAIANIQWSEQPGETKVTISKDGQFATLGFNQALLSQPVANVPVAPGMPQPGGANMPGQNFPKPPQMPTVVTPTPHIRPVIQRNPSSAAQPPNMTPMPANE